MLSVVWIVNRSQDWYERGAAGKGPAPRPASRGSEARSRLVVISALGVVEILAWAPRFYLPAVLAGPIAADTGWPLAWVVGACPWGSWWRHSPRPGSGSPSIGTAASGAGAGRPAAGDGSRRAGPRTEPTRVPRRLAPPRARHGLRALRPRLRHPRRLYGAGARPAITALTLWGGFASTVCWPLSAFLVGQVGWRGACLAYAGTSHPRHAAPGARPDSEGVRAVERPRDRPRDEAPLASRERRAFLLMAGVLVLGGTVMALVSVHLIALLQARGVALAAAVAYGALIGPAQVGARLVEMAGKGRHHPLWTLTAAMVLVALGLAILPPASRRSPSPWSSTEPVTGSTRSRGARCRSPSRRGALPGAGGPPRPAGPHGPGPRAVVGRRGADPWRPRRGLRSPGGARPGECRPGVRLVGTRPDSAVAPGNE